MMPSANILFQNQPSATPQEAFQGVLQNQSALNQFQQQPMQNRLLAAQTQGAEQQNQQEQYKFQLQDLAADWGQVKPLLASGDMTNANVAIAQRIQKIQQRGGDPSDTIELRDRINSGQITPQQAIAEVDGALEGARAAGLLGVGGRISAYQQQNLDLQRQRLDLQKQLTPAQQKNYALQEKRLGLQNDPTLQSQLAGAKEEGKLGAQLETKPKVEQAVAAAKTKGKAVAEAEINLPQTISTAEYSLSVLDQMLNHPGLDEATGASSKADPRNFIPGTDAYNFNVLKDQVQGQTFLQAFESLKGAGQITEVEGNKATNAIARMNTAQSKEEFVKAVNEFKGVIQRGMDKARAKAGGTSQGAQQPAQGGKQGGQIMIDANGNRAMVYPDGSFEEMP
jgi:hypothetical protein